VGCLGGMPGSVIGRCGGLVGVVGVSRSRVEWGTFLSVFSGVDFHISTGPEFPYCAYQSFVTLRLTIQVIPCSGLVSGVCVWMPCGWRVGLWTGSSVPDAFTAGPS
jgi:hypothetical protein